MDIGKKCCIPAVNFDKLTPASRLGKNRYPELVHLSYQLMHAGAFLVYNRQRRLELLTRPAAAANSHHLSTLHRNWTLHRN